MNHKKKPTTNTAKTATIKSFTPLSRKQLQTIEGGDDPKTSRGSKTSIST